MSSFLRVPQKVGMTPKQEGDIGAISPANRPHFKSRSEGFFVRVSALIRHPPSAVCVPLPRVQCYQNRPRYNARKRERGEPTRWTHIALFGNI